MVDISDKIDDVISDKNKLGDVIEELLEGIYKDKDRLHGFLDNMLVCYEDEIVDIISDNIVGGR